MKQQDTERRWERLSRLLEPIHEKAQQTSRNLCRSSADGDDLYQETVLRAFHKLHTLREEAKFRSWFFAVLLSVHRSRTRRAFWKRFLPLEDVSPAEPGLTGEDGHRNEEEILGARRVARALSKLPAVQREAVVLHEIEGFTMEEIASMQSASVAAVKSRVLRGRERLRRHYQKQGRSAWIIRSSSPGPPPSARLERSDLGASPASAYSSEIQRTQGGRHE